MILLLSVRFCTVHRKDINCELDQTHLQLNHSFIGKLPFSTPSEFGKIHLTVKVLVDILEQFRARSRFYGSEPLTQSLFKYIIHG